jgi:hypothetical protein
MKKSDNIFVRAAKYRKEHPRTSFQDAIKKVSGTKKVSGVKKVSGTKKKVSGPKKVAGPKKRAVSGVKAKVAVRGTRKASVSGVVQANKLIKDIERLELKRKNEQRREMKDFIQLQINATHDKLDALKRKYR